MRDRRRGDDDRNGFILCRECFEPLVLDPARMQRLGGRSFIECLACNNLIWVRRGDMHRAMPVTAPDDTDAPTGTPMTPGPAS